MATLAVVGAFLAGAAARAAEPAAPAPAPSPATVGGATLTVVFQAMKTPSGAVFAALADSPAAYADKAPPARAERLEVTAASVEITFKGLTPGTYAVSAFHDLNGDGKLNTNLFGIPLEPYAFSNNARGAMGKPGWAAAAFEVKAGDNRQTIDID